MAVAGGQQDIAGVEFLAESHAAAILAVGVLDIGVVSVDLGAVEVASGDEVDHAADGLGAVGRRRAVLKNLNAADGGLRDEVQVGAAALERGLGAVGQAPAVHQAERTPGAEAAQVDRGRAGAAVVAVRFAQARGRGCQRLDQLQRRWRALLFQGLTAEHIHWQGAVFRCAGDEGAGDDNLADAGAGRGLRGLGRSALRQSKRQRDSQDRAAAEISALQHVGFLPLMGGVLV